MFEKLLIANRGEIACRIIKTAKKLGIKTIAVYSSIDKKALHVQLADESHCIGSAPPLESYLNQKKLIEVALKTKADAIHPGYGFLAENSEFATLCRNYNLIFVGPPASAIAAMGDKSKAKNLMEKAGVPIVLGSHRIEDAKKIGLPLLLKATAGGGGKGMRLVTKWSEFDNALESAKREAKSSFNNDTIFIEKFIKPARHIEIQIFFDTFGSGVHIFSRDCSIQRRHQKIIEESPAPNLNPKVINKMGDTAVKAAKTIQYIGAGTIEFLVDDKENYYFMEMNTRLQVEHPVTEMISGIDLVEWQLRIAAGEPLPRKQSQLKNQGHAIEARICAENPAKDFVPSTGKLFYFAIPDESKEIRIDTGVTQNDTITPYYDPMIAKLIVWGKDRKAALERLIKSLEATHIAGVDTNVSMLHRICQINDFQNAKIDTDFVQNHTNALQALNEMPSNTILAMAALTEIHWQHETAIQSADYSADPFSPWYLRDNWRLIGKISQIFSAWFNQVEIKFIISEKQNIFTININNTTFNASGKWTDNKWKGTINSKPFQCSAIKLKDKIYIFYQGETFTFSLFHPKLLGQNKASLNNQFISPMPGTIVEVFVKPGEKVKQGDRLLIIEAMKMEHTITAPTNGVVKTIFYQKGDLIKEGAELISFHQERQ